MPAEFDRCVAAKGSKTRTMTMGKMQYRHVCIMPNGKRYYGEVKTKKAEK